MKLSLIVLNYNDFTTTENFIKKIKNYKNIENIIVVDNASTDGSYEKLKKYEGTNIAIIKTERNKGYASGNNFGIKYAIENFNPEYLCISNPDIDIEDEVFKNITDFMEKTDKAGIVSGIIYKDEKTENISAWHLPTYKNCILEQLYVLHTLLRKGISYSNDELRKKLVHEVDVIPGCFFVIKTEVMKDIGYFDERTFLYYEENILSKKLHDKNYHNYILSNIKFYHREHVSIEKNIPKWVWRANISFKSRYLYCKEYLKCNKLKLLFLKITFFIGKNEYVIFNKIKKIFKGKK